MRKKVITVVIITLAMLNIAQLISNIAVHRISTDAIPDEETALAVGRAILSSVLGEEAVLLNEPFSVGYLDTHKQYWAVAGFNNPEYLGVPPSITIRKSDGKVLGIFPLPVEVGNT